MNALTFGERAVTRHSWNQIGIALPLPSGRGWNQQLARPLYRQTPPQAGPPLPYDHGSDGFVKVGDCRMPFRRPVNYRLNVLTPDQKVRL